MPTPVLRQLFCKTTGVTFVVMLLATTALIETGCASGVEITARQASKADDVFHKTEFSLWWGLADRTESVECGGNGLQVVSAKTNWLYSLCTVVTLGAVVPQEVEYRCTSASMQNGGILGLGERVAP